MKRPVKKDKSGVGFKRGEGPRLISHRVLIVTEGSKTEPEYFKMLMQELKLSASDVYIPKNRRSSPIGVVNYAINYIDEFGEFDMVYCVFDRDSHADYDDAIKMVDEYVKGRNLKGKFRAITSVPCFEIWYFWHVSESAPQFGGGGSPCDELIIKLKSTPQFKNYDKKSCKEFYSKISNNRSNAINKAKQILKSAQSSKQKKYHENPSTRIHEIVEHLSEISLRRNSGGGDDNSH